MSTYFPKANDVKRQWFLVDATGVPVGRLSSLVAEVLAGKNKPTWTPFIDTGDHVVVMSNGLAKATMTRITTGLVRARVTGVKVITGADIQAVRMSVHVATVVRMAQAHGALRMNAMVVTATVVMKAAMAAWAIAVTKAAMATWAIVAMRAVMVPVVAMATLRAVMKARVMETMARKVSVVALRAAATAA